MSRFIRYIKKKRWVLGALALLLAASVGLPLALLGGIAPPPTLAAAGDPIIGKPGVPIDAAAVDYEIRRYQQYDDSSWTAANQTRNKTATGQTNNSSPNGIFPQGTSGYFNQHLPVLPVPAGNTVTGSKTRDHTLFFPRVLDMTDPLNPIVDKPSIIRFGGYNCPPWFDYVYTEQLDIEIIEFDINPQVWDFHTLKRVGFMFLCRRNDAAGNPLPPVMPTDKNGNGVMDYNANYGTSASTTITDYNNYVSSSEYDPSNGKISGYVFSFGDIALTTMSGPTSINNNFELYYVQNMDIDAYNAYMRSVTPARLATTASGGQHNYNQPANNGIATSTTYTTVASNLNTRTNTANLYVYGFPNSNSTFYTNGNGAAGKHLPRCDNQFNGGDTISRHTGLYDTGSPGQNNPALPNYNPTSPSISNYVYNNTATGMTGTATQQGKMHFELRISDTDFELWLTDVEGNKTTGVKLNNGNPFLLFKDTFATLNPPGSPTPTTNLPTRSTTGKGFGLYMQNFAHNCSQLTVSEFQGFTVKQRNEPTPVRPEVDFIDVSTGLSIRSTYTYHSDLWSTDLFDVEPPPMIVSTSPYSIPDKTYYYFKSDRDGLTYPLTGGSGLTDIPVDVDDNNNNHTTLYYVLAPTLVKNTVVLENQGGGSYTPDPGGIDNGAPTAPRVFPHDDRLQYTITLNNPNAATLTGVPLKLVDVLPPGLKYVSTPSPYPAPTVTVNAVTGQDELAWVVADPAASPPFGLPPGNTEVRVIVRVDPGGYGITFVNGADLDAPDTGLNVTSNRTYHKSTLAPVTSNKDARIRNLDGTYPSSPSNGSSGSRVPLGRGDTLKYTIDVDNPNPHWAGTAYDIIYAIDWSDSMGNNSSVSPSNANYREIAKGVALDFSSRIFTLYPNSRVALMGMNMPSVHNNSGNPALLNLQVDTRFCDASDYSSIITTAYPSSFDYGGDDNPLFLAAAIEKQMGRFTGYGGGTPSALVPPVEVITPVPSTNVVARLDESRIPVIIQVSDWQLNFGTPSTNWTRLQTEMSRFINPAPGFGRDDGVFIGVGFKPNGDPDYDTNLSTLEGYTQSIGGPDGKGGYKWGVIDTKDDVVNSSSAQAANITAVAELLWTEFKELAPLDPGSATLTDTLPPGLETPTNGSGVTVTVNGVVVSSPDVDVDVTVDSNGQYVVTVEFYEFPSGTISVDIICTVASGDLDEHELDNTAHVEYTFEGVTDDFDTNTTYHEIPTYTVTTRWVEYNTTPPSASELGKTDVTKKVIRGNTHYVPAGPAPADNYLDDITYTKPSDISRTYEYYGYTTSTDGGTTYSAVTPGAPPTAGFTINSDLIIVLYFKTTYTITEKFHWDPPPYTPPFEVWPNLTGEATHTVESGDTWTPSTDHGTFAGIGAGPFSTPQPRWISGYLFTWITTPTPPGQAYKKDSDTNPHVNWATDGLTNIQGDRTVIYPYERSNFTAFQVTEEFRKIENTAQLIAADTVTPVPGGNDFSTAVTNFNAKVTAPNERYVYVGYEIDGGTRVFDNPPAPLLTYVTGNHTITYLYAVLASKNALVYYEGTNPDPAGERTGTINVPVIARPGDPAVPTADDEIEYFIYLDIPAGMQDPNETITVVDELPKGLQYLSSDPASPPASVATDPGTQRTTVTWTVPADRAAPITVRVQVVERPPPTTAFVNQALITLNDRPHIPEFPTNPTFHSNILPGDRMLHIRQIILARNPATPYSALPPVGFFEMSNNGHMTSLLSTSGLLLGAIVPFTIYTLPDSADPVYLLKNIVPQFYEWKDYELTHDPLVHDRTPSRLRTNRSISISYLDEREYWLTVYLTPRPLTGQHSWDFRTNMVGTIYHMP